MHYATSNDGMVMKQIASQPPELCSRGAPRFERKMPCGKLEVGRTAAVVTSSQNLSREFVYQMYNSIVG
jgi:hypothetical protein